LKKNFALALYFIIIIWLVFIINRLFNLELTNLGILPRHISGLTGIIFCPFLHGNFVHLISNTLPAFVLLSALSFFYKELSFKVIVFSVILGGLFVWLIGRSSYHIGASGLIYAIAAFLVASGVYRRNFLSILIAIIILLLYGGLIWGVFPTKFYISWEGHLGGAISGIFLAYLYRKKT